MMKRIVATLFFLSLILIALALVAPSFIDWSAHKDGIIAQLKPYLGRNIDVGGKVSFSILPNPRILLEDVTLSNAEGAKADHFMKLKQLEANMKLQPLLQGRFEVEAINLDQPDLDLEVLDDGSNNWTGILKEREAGGGGLENAADTVQFNQITMTGGTLHYLNQVTGASWQVDKLNLTVSADTLFGPYKIAGDMEYKGSSVSVTANTEKFGGGAVPVHIALNPAEKLPQVKFDGTMESQAGVNMTGDLAISQGTVASLFDSDFLKNISFLNETTDLTATLDVKGGDIKVNDIKAKYGKKGELAGSVDMILEKGKKPLVSADLSGAALKITSKPVFLGVPEGFDARLKLKGKSISWNGISMPAAAVNIDTDKEEWVVKNGRFDMPGKSVVKIAGVATPKNKYAAYSIQVTTEDLPALLKTLPLPEGNLLKQVEDSQIVKALDWSSSLDLRPDQASFSDIDAKLGGKIKASGVLDVALDGKSPFKANLNLDDADMSAFGADGWSKFSAAAAKMDGEVEISAKNFSNGDLKLPNILLNARTGAGGVHIKDLSGNVSDGGEFALSGDIAGLNPATGLDIVYRIKTDNPGAVAKALGISLPPPMQADAGVDIHGHIGGDATKYSFNADGHGLSINGTQERDASGAETYQETLHLDKPDNGGVLALLGLPIDRLTGSPKELSGELSGTRANYKISKLEAGTLSGWIERKDDKYAGELTAGTLDFDEWLSSGWVVKDGFSLKLKGKKLVWRGDEVAGPELKLDAGPESLRVSSLTGQIWGGDLTAQAEAHRKGDAWNGTLRGSVTGADLGKLAALMDMRGFSAGSGNIDFDLSSDAEREKEQWFHGATGSLQVRASDLTVKAFAPAAVSELLASLKQPSDDLAQDVVKALLSGDTKYNDVTGSFDVKDGKINVKKLVLANDSAKADIKGSYDIGPETYHLTSDIKLTSPEDAPAFTLNRSGEMKGAPDYSANVRPLQDYIAKRLAKDETKPPLGAEPEAETPPPTEQPATDDAHRVLLKHEGEGEQTPPAAPEEPAPVSPAPVTVPAPAPGPDDKPVQLTPEQQGPPAQPPTLPTPANDVDNGGRIDEPIETEPLAAPPAPPGPPLPLPPIPPPEPAPQTAPSPVPAPAPAPVPPAKGNDHSPIKGILDRLNDGSTTPPAKTEDKPAPAPMNEEPPDDEPVKE